MRPDFSGEYVLNREASRLSELGAANVKMASLRIDHNEPMFSCDGTFTFLSGEPAKWAFELSSDDTVATPRENESSIRWEGQALIARIVTPGPTIVFRYEFDREGRLQLAEQLRGTDHDQDNIWIFNRR